MAVSDVGPAGIVYLVGAGPGDPGLITVRGRALLERCDAVVYDALANPALLDVARAANAHVELHDVGKRGGGTFESARQDEINALLIRLAKGGQRVVRLKGGDPLVFGRGSEEAQALAREGLPFEIVPGVTAGIAAPAYAGIPVTHRGLSTSVTFVTGHEDPTKDAMTTDWAALARAGGTIVLYMGVAKLPDIASALIAGGRSGDTPAAAVQWGTHPTQRTVVATLATLADRIRDAQLSAPVITIIGDTVSLRDEIAWFEKRPLFGKRIVVTRARPQASALADRLREAGATVLEMPAIAIERVDPLPLAEAIEELDRYSWVIFTSQNAVEIFWERLTADGWDARALHRAGIAAIGPATAAALLTHGLDVDVAPDRFVAEALLDALTKDYAVGAEDRILYISAEGARDVLPAGLTQLGASVDIVPVYRTVTDGAGADELRERLQRREVDLLTFTSASSVNAFVAAVGDEAARRAPAASIGPVTFEAAGAAGLPVLVEAVESTIPGLVAAIVAAFGS